MTLDFPELASVVVVQELHGAVAQIAPFGLTLQDCQRLDTRIGGLHAAALAGFDVDRALHVL